VHNPRREPVAHLAGPTGQAEAPAEYRSERT
jgi:hypothetical protein